MHSGDQKVRSLSLPTPAESLLPHSFPMVYIDRLLEAGDDRGLCEVHLTSDHMLLNARGRMDRAGFIELAAQGFATLKGWGFVCQGLPFAIGYLVGVQGFEFQGDACVGDVLLVETVELGVFESFSVVRVMITREGVALAQGKIKLYVPDAGDQEHKVVE